MRTEKEIKDELARIEKELKSVRGDTIRQSLGARKWALKWVLKEEK